MTKSWLPLTCAPVRTHINSPCFWKSAMSIIQRQNLSLLTYYILKDSHSLRHKPFFLLQDAYNTWSPHFLVFLQPPQELELTLGVLSWCNELRACNKIFVFSARQESVLFCFFLTQYMKQRTLSQNQFKWFSIHKIISISRLVG